jgi:hypothetical protein
MRSLNKHGSGLVGSASAAEMPINIHMLDATNNSHGKTGVEKEEANGKLII